MTDQRAEQERVEVSMEKLQEKISTLENQNVVFQKTILGYEKEIRKLSAELEMATTKSKGMNKIRQVEADFEAFKKHEKQVQNALLGKVRFWKGQAMRLKELVPLAETSEIMNKNLKESIEAQKNLTEIMNNVFDAMAKISSITGSLSKKEEDPTPEIEPEAIKSQIE